MGADEQMPDVHGTRLSQRTVAYFPNMIAKIPDRKYIYWHMTKLLVTPCCPKKLVLLD